MVWAWSRASYKNARHVVRPLDRTKLAAITTNLSDRMKFIFISSRTFGRVFFDSWHKVELGKYFVYLLIELFMLVACVLDFGIYIS